MARLTNSCLQLAHSRSHEGLFALRRLRHQVLFAILPLHLCCGFVLHLYDGPLSKLVVRHSRSLPYLGWQPSCSARRPNSPSTLNVGPTCDPQSHPSISQEKGRHMQVPSLFSAVNENFSGEPKRAHLRVPALQTPPKFHEKREKERKLWREREKKERHFGRSGPVEGGIQGGGSGRREGGRESTQILDPHTQTTTTTTHRQTHTHKIDDLGQLAEVELA